MTKLEDMASEVFRATRAVQVLESDLDRLRMEVDDTSRKLGQACLDLAHRRDALAMIASAPSAAAAEALRLEGMLGLAANAQAMHGVFVLSHVVDLSGMSLDQAALALYGISRYPREGDADLDLRGRMAAHLAPEIALVRLAAVLEKHGVGK